MSSHSEMVTCFNNHGEYFLQLDFAGVVPECESQGEEGQGPKL